MAFAPYEQFFEAVKRSRSVGVFFRSAWNGDSLGSALAVAALVSALGKPAEVVCEGFIPHPSYKFLEKQNGVLPKPRDMRRLNLKISAAPAEYDLTHSHADGAINISIDTEGGALDPDNVAATTEEWKHDLIVVVDTPDLAALGAIKNDYRDFWTETPIVNIDHDPGNEQFGQINLVDIRASSTAEIVADLFAALDWKLVDAETATALLAGIISKTKSFRSNAVTPKTLDSASRLVTSGARRAEIVEHLFRMRPVEALRLWGRVLARLKQDRANKLVWSLLTRADFVHAGADETHLPDAIAELAASTSDADVIIVIHENSKDDGNVSALVGAERGQNALHLMAPFKPEGDRKLARVSLPASDLISAEKTLVDHVRKTLAATH
jgi:nanoRNase/pAp phosphatase (c-di-AMP/oligoRNAs hydrolase)